MNQRDAQVETGAYVVLVMAIGFLTFYALPDRVPLLVRMTRMVLMQAGIGMVLRIAQKGVNDAP